MGFSHPTQGGIVARPVSAAIWPLFAGSFEAPGGPSCGCCMAFRQRAAGSDKAARRAGMERRVRGGEPVGLIFEDGSGAAGRCSVAPRDRHRVMGGPAPAAGEVVWPMACPHLRRDRRGPGLVSGMIAAAEDHARAAGATVIAATPVDPDSPRSRFMGQVSSFAAPGYAEVAMAGRRRHVMRKLSGPAP